MKNKIIFFLFTLTLIQLAAIPVQAQQNYCADQGLTQGTCPLGQCLKGNDCVLANPAPKQLVKLDNFGDLAQRIIQIFLAAAGAIAVIFLMVGGFRYVTASGNEEAMEKAKKTVTGAIIGIVIIVMAFAVVAIVNNLLTTPPN